MSLKAQRVAVYCRYSSDRQNPHSIEDQLRVCREYVERADGKVSPDLIFTDAAISGTSTARPGFQALQQAVRDRRIDVVVTEDLSRIGRDVGNNDRAIKELKSFGARLIAINDAIDTSSSSGKLVGAIKSVMSELYIDELKVRTKRGLDSAFDAGGHTGGRAFGYRIVPDGDRKKLEIEPAEADVVRRIFDAWGSGHTLRAISERLNREAVRSPRGQRWTHMTVRALLRNEVYAGVMVFNRREWKRDNETGKRTYVERPRSEWRRRERPDLRIIDPATWHAAQATLVRVKREAQAGLRQRPGYPLSGLLVCAFCGEHMVLSGGERRYYQCGGRRRGIACSNKVSLREQHARESLLEQIRAVGDDSQLIDDMRAHWASTLGGLDRAVKAELAQRRAQLAVTGNKISKLLDYVLEHGETPSTRAKLAELEDHAELQRAAIAKLESELGRVPVIPSADMIRAFLAALPEAALEEPVEVKALLGELLRTPVRCEPVAAGYQLSAELDLSALLNASSAAPARGPRSIVAVAGAGFAHDRALQVRVITWVVPRSMR